MTLSPVRWEVVASAVTLPPCRRSQQSPATVCDTICTEGEENISPRSSSNTCQRRAADEHRADSAERRRGRQAPDSTQPRRREVAPGAPRPVGAGALPALNVNTSRAADHRMTRTYKRKPGSRKYTACNAETLEACLMGIRSGVRTQRSANHY
ncbi:uncharacterized protein LOC124799066 [Schistocerca piceifrons]|uniref:uncharacterized protein LOC124799066 n=1 Tax=Schistocerca piceifrons TaxID=274613 RepID=UPI001F5FF4B7|nr:uncharacterized protein LOC124799066 [Schistocerca piceifrons]